MLTSTPWWLPRENSLLVGDESELRDTRGEAGTATQGKKEAAWITWGWGRDGGKKLGESGHAHITFFIGPRVTKTAVLTALPWADPHSDARAQGPYLGVHVVSSWGV